MRQVKVWMVCMALTAGTVFAQEIQETSYIEVNGSAEVELVPDEIYVVGTISESKAGDLEKNDTQFLKNMKKIGVSTDNISLADLSGEFASAWFKKDQLVKEKTYQVKLESAEMVGKFLAAADESGVKDVHIIRTDISNREAVEKELRIKAVLDAKEKAQYMTEAIGSELGEVQQIRENYISIYRGNERVNDLMMGQSAMPMKQKTADEAMIGFKKIRMEMKVMARFAIGK